MDSETKAVFRALIGAMQTLADSLWNVYDIKQLSGPITGKAALAPNPCGQVEALLAAAKGLVDPKEDKHA